MRRHLKDFFIPHTQNNYHPHILHTKRAIFYSAVFIMMKLVVFSFALFVPLEVFVSPDVLAAEQSKLIALTNDLRLDVGTGLLDTEEKLFLSSHLKANDMSELQYFGHSGPGGHDLAYFLSAANYKYSVAGENLAMGFQNAEDIMKAWIESPTHYNNLVDNDFEEFGLTLYGGMYEGYPVIFVAQHFGTPPEIAVAATSDKPEIILEDFVEEIEPENSIAGEIIVSEENIQDTSILVEQEIVEQTQEKNFLSFSADQSFLNWKEEGEETLIIVRAKIVGDVDEVWVSVGGNTIELTSAQESGVYVGRQIIPESVEEIFEVVTMPTIQIVGSSGEYIEESIKWQRFKITPPSAIDRYEHSKNFFGGMTSLFSVSNNIFLGSIIFFITALVLSIVVEIKRQHPHVIIQTFGLILLLFSLWVI